MVATGCHLSFAICLIYHILPCMLLCSISVRLQAGFASHIFGCPTFLHTVRYRIRLKLDVHIPQCIPVYSQVFSFNSDTFRAMLKIYFSQTSQSGAMAVFLNLPFPDLALWGFRGKADFCLFQKFKSVLSGIRLLITS